MTNGSDDGDRTFIRSTWGTNRYVYNSRNPVGRVLIVCTLLFITTMGLYLFRYHRPAPAPPSGPLNSSNEPFL